MLAKMRHLPQMSTDMYRMWQIKRSLGDDAATLVSAVLAQPVAPTFVVAKHQLARDLATRIERAVRHAPLHFNCMCRSLYGLILMREAGLKVELHIGVAQQKCASNGQLTGLKAHAWLTFADGTIINDHPDTIEQYQPFTQALSKAFVFD